MFYKVQSKSIEVTSYEIWTNKEPYLSHPKVWGYPTYKKQSLSDKLEVKSDKCLYVGDPKGILDINSTTLWKKGCLFQSI